MKTILPIIFIFLIFASAFTAEEVLACSYDYIPSVYQSYRNASFVFVGKPIELKIVEGQRLYRFETGEIFKGLNKREIEINNGRVDNMCDDGFTVGKTYLIYAYGNDEGKLYTGNFASRNELLIDAQDQIYFLRELLMRKRESQIYGSVVREDKSSDDIDNKSTPLQSIKIRVEGNGKSFETLTDANGIYHLNKIPRGEYTIKTVLPDVYESYHSGDENILVPKSGRVVTGENINFFKLLPKHERELEAEYYSQGKISDGGYTKFSILWHNRLKGKVFDSEGKELLSKLKLMSISKPFEDFSKENGIGFGDFIGGITPGKYYLVTDIKAPFSENDTIRYFYPQTEKLEEAIVVDIKGNDKLEFNLIVPIAERKLEGKVFWSDGTQIAGDVRLYLSNDQKSGENKFGAAFLDGTGSFSLSAYVGFEYWLHTEVFAENMLPQQTKPIRIETMPIKIKVERVNEPLKILIPKPDKLPTTN